MPNVYFQPPSTIQMTYPCIVYAKSGKRRDYSNNKMYKVNQEYQIMLIEKNPDSKIADNMEIHFQYCTIDQYYTVDNLNHTTLSLYY